MPAALEGLGRANFKDVLLKDRGTLSFFAALTKIYGACPAEETSKWSCRECTRDRRPDASFRIETESYGEERANLAVVCAFGTLAVVVIRGSKTMANWLADADAWMTALPASWGCGDPDAKAHHGFVGNWVSMQPKVTSALDQLRQTLPPGARLRVLTTGHSLGGAECTLAALDLQSRGENVVGCLSFESPRVFNGAAARYYEQTDIPTIRVTNENDPVVHGPRIPGEDFTHVGDELYMHGRDEFTVCRSQDISACSAQDTLSIDAAQHCDTQSHLGLTLCSCDGDYNTELRVLENVLLFEMGALAAWFLFAVARGFFQVLSKRSPP